jgi:phage-related holin
MSNNNNMMEYIYIKLAAIFTAIMTFFVPIKGMIIIMIIMVLSDTLYALYKAKVKKEIISSDAFFNIVPKLICYTFFILISFMVDTFIFDNKLPVIEITNVLSKIVTFICITIELKSIDETSVKLGNRPFDKIITSFIKNIRKYKKNLNELKDE